MLKVYRFEKRGVKSGSLNDLGNTSICWTDCVNPTNKELKDISEKAKISLNELKKVLDEEERPKVSDLENYSLIIVRTPFVEHHNISTTPMAIFISKNKNNIITITLKETDPIKKIKQLVNSKKIDLTNKSISFLTYKILDEVLNSYFLAMDELDEKIDMIEDRVIGKPDKITVENIFSVKKTLIYFHRALTANREVISSIEKEYVADIDKKNIKRFRALYNDVTQLIDTEATYRDILTGTLDIYLSSVSNNLGQIMKTLTVISAFVLIPTLISGVYGMNFTRNQYNMPELYWQYGYFFALGLMAFSIIAMYIFFRRKGWL